MSHTLGLLEGNNDADDESDETEDEAVDARLCLWAPHISAEGISRFFCYRLFGPLVFLAKQRVQLDQLLRSSGLLDHPT